MGIDKYKKPWNDWLQEEYEKNKDDKWNFDKFKVECNKCCSKNVEVNGFAESENGYYDEHSLYFRMLIKCHNCGNAMMIRDDYSRQFIFESKQEVKK